ncbi:unnamed protein product [Hydatigera taeniaeformis]|uniref:MOSC domain-containing protein n=1 Tax=Hydatigena taeniaeformis TaxID=6205 RepID=A0A0R3WR40_HYDTA|nr:unnamed protein product [Hydatigera taeniaeformis]
MRIPVGVERRLAACEGTVEGLSWPLRMAKLVRVGIEDRGWWRPTLASAVTVGGRILDDFALIAAPGDAAGT